MIIFEKKKTGLVKVIKYLKNIPKSLVILFLLIIIAIPLYYRMVTMREPSLEDQMKEYSKQVNAPEMKIDIKFKNFQKLLYERDKALDAGGNSPWNMSVKFTEVPAKITFEGKEYKADISLKGSRKDHYSDSTRMAYQVTLKGENTIMGMRKFSLHDPKMRNYIYEWMFHELLRREGFIALKYDFIQVKLNGLNSGVYAIEERPDKILLERYGYVEGPIFKLTDDADSTYFNTIEPFSSNKYSKGEWKTLTEKADILARGLSEGSYKFSQTVNADMFARYFAVCDILMCLHGTLTKSVRFYFNPTTEKFEPIGFDGHYIAGTQHFISSETLQSAQKTINYYLLLSEFQGQIFFNEKICDREFLTAYVKYLDKFSSEEYLKRFFQEIDNELTQKTAVIYKNQPLLMDHINSFGPEEFTLSVKHINSQAKYIRSLLNFNKEMSIYRISAKIDSNKFNGRSFELMFSNNYSLPLVLNQVILNDSIRYYPQSGEFIIPSIFFTVRNYKNIIFSGEQNIPAVIKTAKISFKIAGMDSLIYNNIEIFTDKLGEAMEDIIRREDNLSEHKHMFRKSDGEKTIKFKKGKFEVSKYLKIPGGYTVYVESGTEINLKDSAFILSYSPLYIEGTKDNPVKITSDGTGGIAVFNCDSMSGIKNAVFSGLSNPRSEEWKLTGSVTFYKSPVIIQNTDFRDNKSEDYLNVKQSSFKIENCRFDNVSSDAFDSDFSDGEITGTVFNNTGNDAIDISGSAVSCTGNIIIGSKDKAYSSGEGSVLKVKNTKISDSEICFAAKDNSKIESSEIEIINCKLGFAAYQKKPEYGPGEISADKVNIKGLKKDMLIEKGSKLRINGKTIEGEIEDVKDEYLYGKEFGSPSIR